MAYMMCVNLDLGHAADITLGLWAKTATQNSDFGIFIIKVSQRNTLS